MAEDQAQPQSISARIAALKLDQVGRTPSEPPPSSARLQSQARRPPPPRPLITRPPADVRRNTTKNPILRANGSTTSAQIGNQPNSSKNNGILTPPIIHRTSFDHAQTPKPSPPSLPARKGSVQPSPSLPPRRPSEQLTDRRGSTESTSSTISEMSAISMLSAGTGRTSASRSPSSENTGRIKAPVYDPSTLPVLPPKRSETESCKARTPLKATKSSPTVPATQASQRSTPPPALPARRKESVQDSGRQAVEPTPALPKRSALSLGLNKSTEEPPALPARQGSVDASVTALGDADPRPPPIPFASRPSAAQLQASDSRASTSASDECLKCHDFSRPDAQAARFPRQSIPSSSIDWLSQQLTSPFPLAIDKARAIFTWLHHNIEYDVASFFGGNVRPSTPQSTLTSGLAVCEGYAGLFCALATKAGMESVVIGGHGKGYSFAPLPPGSPIPPYNAGHAWSAFRQDDGSWKLVDPCWGAGAVNGPNVPYMKAFNPTMFTMSNAEFGLRHFPDDRRSFFRQDGRGPTWEEYVVGPDGAGEPVQICTAAPTDHGLAETSFRPCKRAIDVSRAGPNPVRFQFEKACPHWDFAVHGPGEPYAFTLAIHGRGGNRDDHVPLERSADGGLWWCDLPASELGRAGQTIGLNAVTIVDGRDARGLSPDGFRAVLGKKSMAWGGVAMWELV